MKAIKRLVAAVLATLMLATSTSFTLAAENYSDKEAVVVAKVNAAGIMTGTDKGFEPSKTLTRAEAAAIIVRMKGISESAVKTAAGTTLFTDVAASHWASGYVNQASNLGIVKGVSATEFAPDREVTVAEFTTMAVRALGAGQLVDAEGTWPTNYVNFANEEGLLDDVNSIYTAVSTRLEAATIVANALETEMWAKSSVKSNGELTWAKNGKNIVTNVLKLAEVKFIADEVSNNNQEVKVTGLYDANAKLISGSIPTGTYEVKEGFDLTGVKVGLLYTGYINEDEEIQGMWLDEADTVSFTSIEKVNTTKKVITLLVDGKEKEYDFAAGNIVRVNEKSAVSVATFMGANTKNENAFGTIYLDNKGDIEAMYVTDYATYAVVDEVTSNKVKMDSKAVGGSTTAITFDVEDNEYFLTKEGKGIKFEDLEEGDAIAYYTTSIKGGKKYVGEVITDIVEGKVKALKGTKVTINGEKYDVLTTVPEVDDEITAFLNKAGDIVMYTKEKSAASDVALVKYMRAVYDKYNEVNWDIKLAYLDETVSDTLSVDLKATWAAYADQDKNDDTTEVTLAASDVVYTAYPAAADNKVTVQSGDSYIGKKAYKVDDTTDIIFTTKENAARYIVAKNVALAEVECYSVSGDKVTFKPVKSLTDAEYATETRTLTIGSRYSYLGSKEVYVDEDTIFVKVKADGTYEKKVEFVSYEDFAEGTIATAKDGSTILTDSYIIDEDEDNDTCKAIIFGEGATIARSTEANFAFIEEIRSAAKVDGKEAKEVDVIYLDGSRKTYSAIDGTTEHYSTLVSSELKLVDLSVKDDVIKDVDLLTTVNTDKIVQDDVTAKVVEYLENKSRLTLDSSAAAFSSAVLFTIAEDALVLELDEDGDYNVKSVSDLEELKESTTDYVKVEYLATYTDEDGTEVKFVIYSVNDKQAKTSHTCASVINNKVYTEVLAGGVSYFDIDDSDNITVGRSEEIASFEITTTTYYHDTLIVTIK